MKKRWLVLFIIFLAGLFFYFEHYRDKATGQETHPVTTTDLQTTYQTYNLTEFDGKLPPDVLLDFDEKDADNMASTSQELDGRFHLSFNRKYVVGARVMNLTVLHEMCHVATWGDKHGLKWQGCMFRLDARGSFREIIIDGYEEPRFQVNGKERN
jgi:hypothetical protein